MVAFPTAIYSTLLVLVCIYWTFVVVGVIELKEGGDLDLEGGDGDLDLDGKGAMLDLLEERGGGKGLAVNPATPAEEILEFLPRLDMVVVMTVNPGFGGQDFLGDNLDKVRRIRQEEEKLSLEKKLNIEVDGGVDRGTIGACLEAGADIFVAGSAIFGAVDPGAATRELIELAGS